MRNWCLLSLLLAVHPTAIAQTDMSDLYRHSGELTKWISPENPTGEKGAGGKSNKGAKGDAFLVVQPGETATLADLKGHGIIRRMWMSGTIPRSGEQRRLVRLQMFWDDAKKAAVDCPIGDFFGVGLGLVASFENQLFSNPEGRSFNFTIPMPYRTAAKVQIVNESDSVALVWYDINVSIPKKIEPDALYFHAFWGRDPNTKPGVDFEILPKVTGRGRYLGTNIGVIGNPAYRGTWFGEGEVKVYLDGDAKLPSLVGTGTEDYIGSGWGQGVFQGRYAGSLVSDDKNDLYAFYRLHIDDPVFFQKECRVTIQQMGNTNVANLKSIVAKGGQAIPVWIIDAKGQDILNMKGPGPDLHRLLDLGDPRLLDNPALQGSGVNFYRSDDVSATAYFYLDRPESDLPRVAPPSMRMHDLRERVWSIVKS